MISEDKVQNVYIHQFGNIEIEESGIRIIRLIHDTLYEGLLGGGNLILSDCGEQVQISNID